MANVSNASSKKIYEQSKITRNELTLFRINIIPVCVIEGPAVAKDLEFDSTVSVEFPMQLEDE